MSNHIATVCYTMAAAKKDIDHLFFTCPFALQCWQTISVQWIQIQDIQQRILITKQEGQIPSFIEILVIAAWEIWNLRNS
ncbi:hypothetical protein Q6247_26505, partial [Klebsiella pneumoniae]